jgi:hypothetical protein
VVLILACPENQSRADEPGASVAYTLAGVVAVPVHELVNWGGRGHTAVPRGGGVACGGDKRLFCIMRRTGPGRLAHAEVDKPGVECPFTQSQAPSSVS